MLSADNCLPLAFATDSWVTNYLMGVIIRNEGERKARYLSKQKSFLPQSVEEDLGVESNGEEPSQVSIKEEDFSSEAKTNAGIKNSGKKRNADDAPCSTKKGKRRV